MKKELKEYTITKQNLLLPRNLRELFKKTYKYIPNKDGGYTKILVPATNYIEIKREEFLSKLYRNFIVFIAIFFIAGLFYKLLF